MCTGTYQRIIKAQKLTIPYIRHQIAKLEKNKLAVEEVENCRKILCD